MLEPGAAGNSPLRAWALDFDIAWPAARSRIATVLRARGLQGADVDDVAQEVAIRALRDRGRFGSYEHFVRWCCRVAINVHLDDVRRQRRLSPAPPPDVAGQHDTAAVAHRRMALEVLATSVEELSPDERRLLFDPEPAGSRREAVRLAVRRHRLRARLAALVEGLAAAFPGMRRLSRSLSAPAKAGLAAVPVVVAGLLVVPGMVALPAGSPAERARPASWVPAPPTGTPARSGVAAGAARGPAAPTLRPSSAPVPSASAAPSSRTLAEVDHSSLPPVKVSRRDRADDHPGLCVFGHVNACLDRPGATVPVPNIP